MIHHKIIKMNFKIKKIKKVDTPKPKRIKLFQQKHITIHLPIIISVIVIFLLLTGIVKAVKSIDFTIFLKAAGEELETDGYNHTNFLILGTGDKNYEGGNLTDSIIVASLDNESELITMVSIPRDLYIKDLTVGSGKINEIYFKSKTHYGSSIEGIEHIKQEIETIIGIPIHYWIKADFAGFKELIDNLGGIDIYVENAIYDPYYPKDGTYLYETFSVPIGQHHMDGATALKYARSRKTTSDFDRANRQQAIIYAIKEKALQTDILFNKDKITNILNTLKSNIETNINVKEILTLGSMVSDFSKEQISHYLIHDDPTICGGFLYTPLQELYGGQFVLLPAGGYEFIHLYSDLMFNQPSIRVENSKIHILNSTKTGGVAGEAKQILQRFCFNIVRFGNGRSKEFSQTTYYYKQKHDKDGDEIDSRPQTLNFLQKLIPGKESTIIPQEYIEAGYDQGADIIIEIGSDYVNSENYINDPFYNLFLQTQTYQNTQQANQQTNQEIIQETNAKTDEN